MGTELAVDRLFLRDWSRISTSWHVSSSVLGLNLIPCRENIQSHMPKASSQQNWNEIYKLLSNSKFIASTNRDVSRELEQLY